MSIFSDPSPEQSAAKAPNVQDVVPPTERSEDAAVTDETNDLTRGSSRPLTEEERKAADRDVPVAERVYAPASARVAVDPIPGHRDFVSHPDTQTAERQAAPQPSYAYGTRSDSAPSTSNGTYNDAAWNTESRSRGLPVGLGMAGWALLGIGGGVGGWLYLRWRRERNKPINRLRRQAKQAAVELRDRVPSSPEEAVRPAAGLTTALISILVILYQQAQARQRQADKMVSKQSKKAGKAAGRASDAVSDLDLQKRLSALKKRWDPSRLELEKMSLSRR